MISKSDAIRRQELARFNWYVDVVICPRLPEGNMLHHSTIKDVEYHRGRVRITTGPMDDLSGAGEVFRLLKQYERCNPHVEEIIPGFEIRGLRSKAS